MVFGNHHFGNFEPPSNRKQMEILSEIRGLKTQLLELTILEGVSHEDPVVTNILMHMKEKLIELERSYFN